MIFLITIENYVSHFSAFIKYKINSETMTNEKMRIPFIEMLETKK